MGFESPILITGAARSGTSMTAGIIHKCGAWGGVLSPPNQNNKRGMFENMQIRQCVKSYLKSLGVDQMGQKPLPDLSDSLVYQKLVDDGLYNWVSKIRYIINREGYVNGTWFYKGAKMCLMWPLWYFAFPKARWIIVRRNVEDIIYSCLRTGFMSAYKDRNGWLTWVQEHEKRFKEMHDTQLNIKEIWPQTMINGDFSEIKAVVDSLGLQWKEKEIEEFIIPALWKGGKHVEQSNK